MGLLNALKKLLPKVSVAREYHNAPSDRFAHQTDLMEYLIERIAPDAWASFEATEGGQQILIQVTRDSINTCNEAVDVPAIARQIGLTALADSLQPSGDDRSLHQIGNASPGELAAIVHGIILHHFKFTSAYRLEGWLES